MLRPGLLALILLLVVCVALAPAAERAPVLAWGDSSGVSILYAVCASSWW
jgi:hypothetical protein